MADYAIHDTTLTGISNVIRKKDGTSALIDPADYADRINLMGMLEEKTESGTIAHFDDGADAVPLKSLVASIVPIGGKGTPQSPIAISGVDAVKITHTGKNMLNPATCQRGYIEGNGNIHVAQTYQELYSDYIKIKSNTTYTFSGTVNNSYEKWRGIAYYDKDKNFIIRQAGNSGTDAHFAIGYVTPSNAVYARCTWRNYSDISSGGSVCPCQLEEGTETEYDAYTGTTYDVEIPNPNPNLRLTADVDEGMWTTSGTINPSSGGGFGRALTMAVSEKTSYDIYGLLDDLIVYLDSNKTMLSYERLSNTSLSLQNERKTTPANCAYIGLSALAFDVSSVSVKESFFVYVGQYDAISGTLTITHIMRTYNTADMDNNNEIYAGWRSANIRDVLGTGLNQRFSNQTLSVGTDFSANTMGATNDLLMLPQSLYNLTQTEWQGMALDVQICLPLITPIVIQLDPIAIDSKAGSNNIWNDAGDSESEVGYRGQGIAYIYPEGEGVSF